MAISCKGWLVFSPPTSVGRLLCFYSAPQCSHCKRCTGYSNSVRLSVCLSVRPSVCHTPVLCQNDGTQHGAVCTVRQQNVSIVLWKLKMFHRDDPFLLKSWFKPTYPLLIAASLYTFALQRLNGKSQREKFNYDELEVVHGLSNEPSTKVLRRP